MDQTETCRVARKCIPVKRPEARCSSRYSKKRMQWLSIRVMLLTERERGSECVGKRKQENFGVLEQGNNLLNLALNKRK